MTNCARCGVVLVEGRRARGHTGVVQWCINCPPAEEYMWDRYTVTSGTGWAGGRVGVDSDDENSAEVDPRDYGDVGEFNPKSGGIITGGEAPVDYDREATNSQAVSLRRDRVTAGPLANVDLVHYMRTGVVRKLEG